MEYHTTKGRLYGFSGWEPDGDPLTLFDQGKYLECLHAAVFAASRLPSSDLVASALEDDGVIHELVHLVAGIDICTHNTMADLRRDLEWLINAAEASS